MFAVLQGFSIIFFVIGVGYLLARKGIIGEGPERLMLNRIAFFAATPALVFTVVARSASDTLFSPVIVVTTLTAIIIAGVYAALHRWWLRGDPHSAVIGSAASCYVNSNNIGLPVGMYVLGSAGYVAPLLVVQMAVFTPIILAALHDRHASSRLRSTFTSVGSALVSPVVLGAFAGLTVSVSGWTVPPLIWEPLTLLGGASIPMILMSFGASLRSATPLSVAEHRRATLVATGMKTVAMPLVAWGIGSVVGLQGPSLYAAVVLASLPTAQNIYNYAATYERGQVVARDTVLLTTFLALPSMLVVAALLHGAAG